MASRVMISFSALPASIALLLSNLALAQEPAPAPPPPTQAFPAPAQPAPQAQPQPAAQPQPQPYPTQPQYPAQQPPASQPSYGTQPSPGADPNAEPGYGYSQPRGAEPPPPPEAPNEGFQRPELSNRIDPLTMLFESRLGIELETQVWKFISFEVVPVFVISERAPTLNYFSDFNSSLRQKSNGIGSLSGALFDVAFWFGNKPFRGYGLRVGVSDYGYAYETRNDAGALIDSVKKNENQFVVMLATVDRWGAFTLGGGLGVGYDLAKKDRCFDPNASVALPMSQRFKSTCSNPAYEIAVADTAGAPPRVDLKSPLAPFDLLVRLSLGVTF